MTTDNAPAKQGPMTHLDDVHMFADGTRRRFGDMTAEDAYRAAKELTCLAADQSRQVEAWKTEMRRVGNPVP